MVDKGLEELVEDVVGLDGGFKALVQVAGLVGVLEAGVLCDSQTNNK